MMKKSRYVIRSRNFTVAVWLVWLAIVCWVPRLAIAQPEAAKTIDLVVEWEHSAPDGAITMKGAKLNRLFVTKGEGQIKGNRFFPNTTGVFRLELSIVLEDTSALAAEPPIVHVETSRNPFSFFVNDVSSVSPIFLADYNVVVLPADDKRSYVLIAEDMMSQGLLTKLETLETQQEATYEAAEKVTIKQFAPTLLGISRDFRIFQFDERVRGNATYSVKPTFSYHPQEFPAQKLSHVAYAYAYGRGVGVYENTSRSLEDGIYPIRHTVLQDDGVEYHATAFVSLESSPLKEGNIRGTNYLVADKYSAGSMLTEAQQQHFDALREGELSTGEETVLYFRVKVTNEEKVPKYAWFKTAKPGTGWWINNPYNFDTQTGFSSFSTDSVFAISKVGGRPLLNEETAILLAPGESTVFQFYLPHSPISSERALKLAAQDFDVRLQECKMFWDDKLRESAKIKVPEKRIQEMINAGLLHLDLITFGREPDSTLAPLIGNYSPIGTESSPIIQYYSSIGWHDVAKRSLQFFLDKQHDNGFIQNFGGYMVETGAALYTIGEYFRYSRDIEWVKRNKERILKSCDFLINWRNENKREEWRGIGYGMIAGKVADPEDHFHQFMLNGYGYIGIKRMAELLRTIDPLESKRLEQEASEWRTDIRASFFHALAQSPVVPLNDGRWVRSSPPWAGGMGLRAMNLENENYWSHGTFMAPDGMLGPLYLAFCEVLEPDELVTRQLLDYHVDMLFQHNTAFSQPYYSRHDWLMAKLGLVKPFLNNYYHAFAGLVDRETHTFWEHVFEASSHKTHEEAWFLMQTRWMLYMEDGNALDVFKTIPRAWMADGEEIVLDGIQSYFGPLRVEATSNVGKGYIEATVESTGDRKPETVRVRLPHPDYRKPVHVDGGIYDEATETVIVDDFSGKATVRLTF